MYFCILLQLSFLIPFYLIASLKVVSAFHTHPLFFFFFCGILVPTGLPGNTLPFLLIRHNSFE